MRLAVVGSRDYPDEDVVRCFIRSLPRDWTIVSGGAPGPDTWAVDEARALGMHAIEFKADWKRLGNAAGMQRNGQIAAAADACVAFWDGASDGTLDTVQKMAKLKKRAVVVRVGEPTPPIETL